METTAKLKHVRIAPRKMVAMVDEIRGKSVNNVLTFLRASRRKRTADALSGLVRSAVDIVLKKGTADVDKLYIKTVFVGEGPRIKRFRPRAKGSAFPIIKGTSHVTLTVAEK